MSSGLSTAQRDLSIRRSMGDKVMDELNKVLGQVPQMVKEGDSARAKLEAIWRIMGWHRSGMQTQIAGELAERWRTRNQSPQIPTDDPRKAAKRLEKMFNGETSLPLDLSLLFIECLPEPFRAAAKVMLFPRGRSASADLADILSTDQQHDERTDHLRFLLATGRYKDMTAEQLDAAAMAFEDDSHSSKELAAALRAMAGEKRAA